MTDRRRRPQRSLAIVSAVLLVASGAIANVGVVAQPLPAESAPPGRTTWESPRPDWGVETPVMSADGNWVAFQSASSHIVPDDTNGVRDIFLLELATGSVTRVSVASDGTQANGSSGNAVNVNGIRGIDYDAPAISGDGRFVAFQSSASNLVPGDGNGVEDVFVFDRGISPAAPSTMMVSRTPAGVPANGASRSPAISQCMPDQRCAVAFVSTATNLHASGSDGKSHVYRWSHPNGEIERMDCSSSTPQLAHKGDASSPSIGAMGFWVAFAATVEGEESTSVLLSSGDCSVQLDSTSMPRSDGADFEPVVTEFGDYYPRVVYATTATNVIPGQHLSGRNVVMSVDGVRRLLSGGEFSGRSHSPAIGASGGSAASSFVVAFVASPTGDIDPEEGSMIVVQSGDTWLPVLVPSPSRSYSASTPSLAWTHTTPAPESRLVFGASPAGESVAGRSLIVEGRVRTDPTAGPPNVTTILPTELPAIDPSLSDDGRWVAFASSAPDLVPGDRNGSSDVFVRNIDTGALVRVSLATDGSERVGGAAQPAVSADGRYVAFAAAADLAHTGSEVRDPSVSLRADGSFESEFDDGVSNVYVRDRDTDKNGIFDEAGKTRTVLVSRGYNVLNGVVSPVRSRGASRRPDITPDGQHVTYETTADDLAEDGSGFGNDGRRVVVAHDRDADGDSIFDDIEVLPNPTGPTTQRTRTSILTAGWKFDSTSRSLVPATAPVADGNSAEPVISASGRYVAFTTEAENLLRDGAYECVPDATTATTEPPVVLLEARPMPASCPSGTHAAGYNFAANQGQRDVVLVDRDPDGDGTFDGGRYVSSLRDENSIQVEIVSRSANGGNLNAPSTSPSISDDGRLVTFVTSAPGVVGAPSQRGVTQVYLRDVTAEANELVSAVGTGLTAAAGDRDSDDPSISANGRMVAFRSGATNLVRGDPDGMDVLVRDLRTVSRSTVIASVSTGGEPGENTFPSSGTAIGTGETGTTIDGTGRRVGFSTNATSFDPRDANGIEDVYVRTWLPDLLIRPNPVDFGTVATGTTSAQQTVSVENRGFGPIRITGQETTGPDAERFMRVAPGFTCREASGGGQILDRTETCAVSSHTFNPTAVGARSALVTVLTEDTTIRPTVLLAGVGRNPTSESTDPPDSSAETTTTTAPPVVVLRHTPFIDVTPNVTLAGRAVEVRGGGFPEESRVELRWSIGIPNSTIVRTDSLGSFTTSVLLLPNDFVGPRALEAHWVGGPPATDDLLVVRGTVDRDFISRR